MNPSNLSLTRGLAIASAGLLITASTGFGSVYAWSIGAAHGPLLGALTVALAIGLEIAKPLAIDTALAAFSRFHLLRGALVAALGLTAVLYSVTAELSLVSLLRGEDIAGREHMKTSTGHLEDRRKTLTQELAGLPSTRPAATIAAEITALEATPGFKTCDAKSDDFDKVSRKVCPKLSALNVEGASATRRGEIGTELGEIDGKLSAAGPVMEADPAATAIVTYAKLLGFTLDTKAVSELLTLVPVLALELGSALSLVLIRAASGQPRAVRASPAETRVENAPEQAPEALDGGSLTPTTPELGSLSARLLEHLSAAGGKLEVGQRRLARELGVSTTRAHQVIHQLAKEGAVKVSRTATGTALELVTPALKVAA